MKKEKKLRMLLAFAFAFVLFFGIGAVSEAKAKPKLNKTKITITVGAKKKLKVKNAAGKKIKWSVKKKSIASVSKNGVVKGKKVGKTVVTAKVGKKKLRCKVTVLQISKKKLTLSTGMSYRLSVKGTKKAVKWSSGNPSVATVSSKGTVYAKKAGSTVVTAKVLGKKLTCCVTVKKSAANGHEYALYDLGMTWDKAALYCQKLGGHLATVTSAEEEQFVDSMVSTGQKNIYWLGGYADTDRAWHWVTGEDFSYTHWSQDQPDNNMSSGGETALMIYRVKLSYTGSVLYWNDINVDGTCGTEPFFGTDNLGFICEWEEN